MQRLYSVFHLKYSKTKPCLNFKQFNFKVTFAHSSDSIALLTTRLGANLLFSFASAAPTSLWCPMRGFLSPTHRCCGWGARRNAEEDTLSRLQESMHSEYVKVNQHWWMHFRKQVSQAGWAAVVVAAALKNTGWFALGVPVFQPPFELCKGEER